MNTTHVTNNGEIKNLSVTINNYTGFGHTKFIVFILDTLLMHLKTTKNPYEIERLKASIQMCNCLMDEIALNCFKDVKGEDTINK